MPLFYLVAERDAWHYYYWNDYNFCFNGNRGLAAVLKRLLKDAIDIKSENDLTV